MTARYEFCTYGGGQRERGKRDLSNRRRAAAPVVGLFAATAFLLAGGAPAPALAGQLAEGQVSPSGGPFPAGTTFVFRVYYSGSDGSDLATAVAVKFPDLGLEFAMAPEVGLPPAAGWWRSPPIPLPVGQHRSSFVAIPTLPNQPTTLQGPICIVVPEPPLPPPPAPAPPPPSPPAAPPSGEGGTAGGTGAGDGTGGTASQSEPSAEGDSTSEDAAPRAGGEHKSLGQALSDPRLNIDSIESVPPVDEPVDEPIEEPVDESIEEPIEEPIDEPRPEETPSGATDALRLMLIALAVFGILGAIAATALRRGRMATAGERSRRFRLRR